MIGTSIENYQIEELLGQGGMGSVYRALDTSLDRIVALKIMNPGVATNADFLRRFKSEARVLGRLQHPHIVNVYAFRHVEPHLIIVMEHVGGGTLSDLIDDLGPIPIPKCLELIKQSLSALEYAHTSNIIHRDIKPPNILLTPQHLVKISDFGLAKIQEDSNSTMVTRVGMTGGTLHYMPPEQTEALSNVDHRGDLYSLGMTFYQMLAGRVPFEKNSSAFSILRIIDQQKIPPPNTFIPDIPGPLVEVVMKSIRKYPEDRFQDAAEMRQALDAFESGAWKAAPVDKTQIMSEPISYPQTIKLPPSEPQNLFQNKSKKEGRSGSSGSRAQKHARDVHQVSNLKPPAKTSDTKWKVILPLVAVLVITGLILIIPKAFPGNDDTSSTVEEAAALQQNEEQTVPDENDRQPQENTTQTPGESDNRESQPPESTSTEEPTTDAQAGEEETTPDVSVATKTIRIRSNPPGAVVFLNGERWGITPLTIVNVIPERQSIELQLDGYRTASRSMDVAIQSELSVDLVPLLGQLRIIVRPYGDLYIDEALKVSQSSVPYEEEVRVGTYTVRAEHPVLGSWSKEVQIRDGQLEEVFFNFNQEFYITVGSRPSNAEILVDGEQVLSDRGVPLTTSRRFALRPGNHTITVRKEGYEVVGSPVEILLEKDISEPFFFELEEQ